MLPKARTAQIEVKQFSQSLLLVDLRNERSHELEPLPALVWQLADGVKSVPAILVQARQRLDRQLSEAQIWGALDTLTELDLMETRLAPPAGEARIGRRGMVRYAASGVAAVFGLAAAPAFAQSEQESKKSAETEAKKSTEQKAKVAERAAVAAEKERKAAVEKADKQAEAESKKGDKAAEQAKKELERRQAEQKEKLAAEQKRAAEETEKSAAKESKAKAELKAVEEKSKLGLNSQEAKEKSAAREQKEKLSLKAQEEKLKVAAQERAQAEQKAKASAELESKKSEERRSKQSQEQTAKEDGRKEGGEQREKQISQERTEKSNREETSKERVGKRPGGWAEIAVNPQWQNVGQGYETARVYRQGTICVLGGLIHRAEEAEPSADGFQIGTLPEEARPEHRRVYSVWGRFGDEFISARVDVLPDGRIFYVGGERSPGWLSLDGIVFPAA